MWLGLPGLEMRLDFEMIGLGDMSLDEAFVINVTELLDLSRPHMAAARARVARLVSASGHTGETLDTRHLHFQMLLQLQGLSNVPTMTCISMRVVTG
jgi:hypothetical protein